MRDSLAGPADVISTVVVDDHPMFRTGLVHAVCVDGDIAVIGEGGSAADAIGLVRDLQPDILLLDARMSDSGIDSIGAVLLANPHTSIIMVTASEDESDIATALEAGVAGYVLKGTTGPDMRNIIRSVHAGETFIPQGIIGRLFTVLRTRAGDTRRHGRIASLSRQEIQALQHLALGLSNREIGLRIGVAERTVKFHLSNIFAKLDVRNRVEASIVARTVWPDLGSLD